MRDIRNAGGVALEDVRAGAIFTVKQWKDVSPGDWIYRLGKIVSVIRIEKSHGIPHRLYIMMGDEEFPVVDYSQVMTLTSNPEDLV